MTNNIARKRSGQAARVSGGRSRSQAAQQVRIIGGQWKRTPLAVLDAADLRPTPDRVRETVFNWLNHLLDGDWGHVACLDLFAGTGVLGFEAASRGAARVVLVEESGAAVRQLEAVRSKLNAAQVSIVRGDALAAAQRMAANGGRNGAEGMPGAQFDVIFLDPPYHQEWLARMLPLCVPLLAEGGIVYAESELALESEPEPAWLAGWQVIRADKAGMVFFHLLQRKTAPGFEA